MRRAFDDLGDLALVLFARHRARPVDAEIAGRIREQLRCGFHRRLEVDHRRQLFVFDLHEVGGVLRGGLAFRHHHRDQVADMHRRFRQHRAERHRHLGAAASCHRRMARNAADPGRLDVLRGEHRQHAFGLARLVGVDRSHPRMRVRRTHEGGVGRIGQARVVHETAGAAHQGIVFDARRASGACRIGLSCGNPEIRVRGFVYSPMNRLRQGLASMRGLRHSGAPCRAPSGIFAASFGW